MTIVVYWKTSTHEFLNYDDQVFVWENPHVSTGLSISNIRWAFTTLNGDAAYYIPLTWVSHQLDCQLFGLRPGPHHLTNLLFHVFNSILLLALLDTLTQRLWCSFGVVTLFALHPLHVETVAWISERKSLVCTLFWLLTTLMYVRYARNGRWTTYLWVVFLYTASLLAKPLSVSLPFTLLLLDFWPLGRFPVPDSIPLKLCSRWRLCERTVIKRRLWLLVEKAPLLLLALAGSVVAVLAQADLGAICTLKDSPMGPRLQNAVVSCFLYLRKLILPVDMAIIYPFRSGWVWWQVLGCASVLFGVSICAMRSTVKRQYLFVGWFWYLITIAPMLGLVRVGSAAMADRYSYITLIGILIASVWSLSELTDVGVKARRFVVIGYACMVTLYALVSVNLVNQWKTTIRVFTQAVRATDRNGLALFQLGMAYQTQGNLPEAEQTYRKAIMVEPGFWQSHVGLGDLFFARGDEVEALNEYTLALALKPDNLEVHGSLANFFSNSDAVRFRDPAKALEHAKRACELTKFRRRNYLVLLAQILIQNRDGMMASRVAQRVKTLSAGPREIKEACNLIDTAQMMQRIRNDGSFNR